MMIISGCTRTKPNPKTQALYTLLMFKDKNENGTIEKASILNLWTDEGYDEEADLNMDGKIVEAEAKFYMWSLSNIALKDKQKYPISEEDKKVLQVLFSENLLAIRATTDQSLKAAALSNIALKMAEAGLDKCEIYKIFMEALVVSKTIETPTYKAKAAVDIVIKMADARLFKEALEAIPAVQGSYLQSRAIGRIIDEIFDAKLDKKSLKLLFCGALEMSRRIKDPYYKALVIKDLAFEMAKSGFDKKETRQAFKEALIASKAITDVELYLRTIIVGNITSAMAEVDFEKEEIMKLLIEVEVNLI